VVYDAKEILRNFTPARKEIWKKSKKEISLSFAKNVGLAQVTIPARTGSAMDLPSGSLAQSCFSPFSKFEGPKPQARRKRYGYPS
jgi:hypothetical protein